MGVGPKGTVFLRISGGLARRSLAMSPRGRLSTLPGAPSTTGAARRYFATDPIDPIEKRDRDRSCGPAPHGSARPRRQHGCQGGHSLVPQSHALVDDTAPADKACCQFPRARCPQRSHCSVHDPGGRRPLHARLVGETARTESVGRRVGSIDEPRLAGWQSPHSTDARRD